MSGRVDFRRDVTGVAGASDAPTTVRVLVLGPLVVKVDDRPLHVAGSHRRRLLALLASRAGRVVAVDAIVDALWGEDPPPTATKTIQSHVARLRASFTPVEGSLIETVAGGYRLAVDPAAVDAVVFERLSAEGRRLLAAGEPSRAVGVLGEALALWRGPAYTEFAMAEFAAAEAIRLDELRWAAIEEFAEARLEAGAVESVIADLEGLVVEQPGRERAWGLLMRAFYAAGRQHEALVAFQRARRALADGFGLDPGPELCGLERRVLEQDPDLTVRRRPRLPAGLCRDPNPLVGRERELAWLTEGWRVARRGSGQLRMLLGPVDSGRTRLAAELAATVIGDGGQVVHARAPDGLARPLGVATELSSAPGAIVDVVIKRSRVGPLLLVVDDAEWSSEPTITAIAMLADLIEQVPVMVLVVADPSGAGPAIHALRRLDRSGAQSLTVEPLPDEAVARIVTADGAEGDAVAAIVAVAGGLAGVARREATAWAERTASDRLTAAAAAAIGATAIADDAQASVFDEVLALVAARARRDELVSATWAGRQPYRALAAYGSHDADLFVGRERLVAELAARILDRRLVVVIGASGSGKSSLVRAGLVPIVRSGRLPGTGPWRASVIIPGDDPLGALDAVEGLDEPGPQLLVVDQFEEAFTSGVADTFAARLVDLVLDAALDVHAVLVVRADQYPALAATSPLGELVDDAQVVVGAPSDDEWRRIIEIPARRTGCIVEPDLVAAIGQDVTGRDAALPLVSTALAEVWERRDGDTLTADSYGQLGGLAAAVDRMGVRAVERAGDGDAVREVMLRLVDVTEDGQWVRRRIDVDEIPDRLESALDALVSERLVQLDDQQLDVVHEIVFRAWPQLAAWLEAARHDLLLDHELRAAARAWDAQGRSDDDVYRGARLAAATEYTTRRQDLAPPVAEFVTAGQRVAERQHEQVRQQLTRETRARRRLSRALNAAAILLAGALAAGALALVNQRRADREADRANEQAELANIEAERADQEADRANEQAELANAEAERAGEEARRADQEANRARAQALAASAVSTLDEDPSLAKLLAVASATIADPTVETMAVLHGARAADRVVARPGPTYDLTVRAADIDPGGRRMAVAGAGVAEGSGKVVDVVDLAAGTTEWAFEVDDASAWVVTPRFSPGGEHVAAGVFWDPHNRDRVPTIERGAPIDEPPPDLVGIRVSDADTGELVEQHDVGRCGGFPAAISATHVLVRTLYGSPAVMAACDWRLGTIGTELVDRRTGERRLLTEDSRYQQRGTAMSDDGTTVAYDDRDASGERHDVVVADTSTGEPLLRLARAPGRAGGVRALSHDGSLLLYGDQPIEVWDVAAGEQVASFDGHQGGAGFATFSPSGMVLSTGADGTMREWDPATGEEIRVYPGIAEGPVAAASDGRVLTIGHSGANYTPAALIDVGAHGELGAIETCPGSVAADSLEVAGGLAVFHVTCDGDLSATTYVVDVQAGRVRYTLPGHQGPALAVSPDGTRFVRQEGEGTTHGPLAVRDVRTGEEIVELEGLCTWDASSPSPPDDQAGCTTYPEPPFGISAWRLKWSPDGTMIAAAAGTAVVVWDADTGALLHAEEPNLDRIFIFDVIFSPDSQLLITTSNDTQSRVISTATWQVVSTGIGTQAVGMVGFSPDGSKTLVALNLMAHDAASLMWFDGATQQITLSRGDIHEGRLQSVALSQDGALVATAASDGRVRVWDAPTLELVHEVALGDTPIRGVAFVDDHHLAVTPQDGNLLLVTIDPDELLGLVHGSLTRGFTATECTRFDFGDDCPTLAELRGHPDGADDSAVLNGTVEVSWTPERFDAALAAAGEPKFAGTRYLADGYPGTYTVTFDDGRFDILHDEFGVYCTGSYTVTGYRVQMFAERRDWQFGCLPGRFLDATYVLTDDALTFSAATAHPVDTVLIAGRPLTRVEG